jgi:hypothetical protein
MQKILTSLEIYANIYRLITNDENVNEYKINIIDRKLLIEMIINMTSTRYCIFFGLMDVI